MQQTNKYKLNLIEKTDTFSPDPLNDNMRKVEAQFDAARAEMNATVSTEAAARAAADSALAVRITELETHKVAAGAYTGTGGARTFDLGFTPIIVAVYRSSTICAIAVPGRTTTEAVEIVENGFTARYKTLDNSFNTVNAPYSYFAIA